MKTTYKLFIALITITHAIFIQSAPGKLTMVPFDLNTHGQIARDLYDQYEVPATVIDKEARAMRIPSILNGEPEMFASSKASPKASSIVMINDEIAGLVIHHTVKTNTLQVDSITLKPEYRARAANVIQDLEQMAKANNLTSIVTFPSQALQPAWISRGFKTAQDDDSVMKKDLRSALTRMFSSGSSSSSSSKQ